ncbi:MAG: FAD-dependent oxidoreductase [Proteobacteria bacterium]|nr:FAD-dependent oxidoreductase [Pseudomonadota bacterium]
MKQHWDVIIVGAGTAGLMAAIFASQRGGNVLLLEAADDIGGTLHISAGNMSAAGTALQAEKGIADTPKDHFDDVMRICRGTADPALVQLAVDGAAATFDWLVNGGLKPDPACPAYGNGAHENYRIQRYVWGPEGGRSILKAIQPRFFAAVASGGVQLNLGREVTELLRDATSSGVSGVAARGKDGKVREYMGTNVLLATGGYAASQTMMARIHGCPLYSVGAMPWSKGTGIELAESVGGYVRGSSYYHANFGVVLASYDYPSKTIGRAVTMPEVRQPWEIYVDSAGQRFVQEDEPSVDMRERKLADLPDRRYWIVFDDKILADSPPLMEGWTKDQLTQAFDNHTMFVKADSLEQLAHKTGMNAQTLETTVGDYNKAIAGKDPMGRTHRPRAIEKGPFYAVRQHQTLIVSTAGITVDSALRVVTQNGKPITNLFAAGEVLGSVGTMGDAAANGMLVTPALTFGRVLGQDIMRWSDAQLAAAE